MEPLGYLPMILQGPSKAKEEQSAAYFAQDPWLKVYLEVHECRVISPSLTCVITRVALLLHPHSLKLPMNLQAGYFAPGYMLHVVHLPALYKSYAVDSGGCWS